MFSRSFVHWSFYWLLPLLRLDAYTPSRSHPDYESCQSCQSCQYWGQSIRIPVMVWFVGCRWGRASEIDTAMWCFFFGCAVLPSMRKLEYKCTLHVLGCLAVFRRQVWTAEALANSLDSCEFSCCRHFDISVQLERMSHISLRREVREANLYLTSPRHHRILRVTKNQ